MDARVMCRDHWRWLSSTVLHLPPPPKSLGHCLTRRGLRRYNYCTCSTTASYSVLRRTGPRPDLNSFVSCSHRIGLQWGSMLTDIYIHCES